MLKLESLHKKPNEENSVLMGKQNIILIMADDFGYECIIANGWRTLHAEMTLVNCGRRKSGTPGSRSRVC